MGPHRPNSLSGPTRHESEQEVTKNNQNNEHKNPKQVRESVKQSVVGY